MVLSLVVMKLTDSLLLLLPTAQPVCISTVISRCQAVGIDALLGGRTLERVGKELTRLSERSELKQRVRESLGWAAEVTLQRMMSVNSDHPFVFVFLFIICFHTHTPPHTHNVSFHC